ENLSPSLKETRIRPSWSFVSAKLPLPRNRLSFEYSHLRAGGIDCESDPAECGDHPRKNFDFLRLNPLLVGPKATPNPTLEIRRGGKLFLQDGLSGLGLPFRHRLGRSERNDASC